MPLSPAMSSGISVPQAVPIVDGDVDMIALAHMIPELACQRPVLAPCPVCEEKLRQQFGETAATAYRQRFPPPIGAARQSHLYCPDHRPSVLA